MRKFVKILIITLLFFLVFINNNYSMAENSVKVIEKVAKESAEDVGKTKTKDDFPDYEAVEKYYEKYKSFAGIDEETLSQIKDQMPSAIEMVNSAKYDSATCTNIESAIEKRRKEINEEINKEADKKAESVGKTKTKNDFPDYEAVKEYYNKYKSFAGLNKETADQVSMILTMKQTALATSGDATGEFTEIQNMINALGRQRGESNAYNNPLFSDDSQGGEKVHSINEIIEEGDTFLNNAVGSSVGINGNVIKTTSETVYTIFLGVGMVVSVIVGIYLGIKFMLAGVEDKADVKKALWAYFVGCFVIFGAFGIWKLVLTIMKTM